MHHVGQPAVRRSVRAWAQGMAMVCAGVLAFGGVAAAAPSGEPGPPPQAQGNGPPAVTPPQQANDHAKQNAPATTPTSRARTGGNAAARANGHAGGTGQATVTGGGSSSSHGQANGHAKSAVASQGQGEVHGHAGKTSLCHATGSESNPYVGITISNNGVPAHDRHQNDEDIIAPTGECPSGTVPTGLGNPPSGIVSGGNESAGTPAGEAPASGVMGVSEERGSGPGSAGEVQGAEQGGVAGTTEVRDTTGTSLPFTGLGIGLLVALGALLAVTGLVLRRRTA